MKNPSNRPAAANIFYEHIPLDDLVYDETGSKIGGGGFGDVFKAYNKGLNE